MQGNKATHIRINKNQPFMGVHKWLMLLYVGFLQEKHSSAVGRDIHDKTIGRP